MKKFSLTSNTMVKYGRTLFQIKAEVSFDCVEKGDLGGWVEDESSLGDKAWIHPDVVVFSRAKIHGGEIHGGVIWGGEIHGGEIHGGVIRGGVIHGGVIHGGVIRGGVIHGGVIRGGVIRGGVIHGGVSWGGVIRGGVIHGGVIWGGVIWGGEIWGGEIWGGVIHGGVIRGGVIHGGVIWGGEIWGGNHIGFANVGSESGYLLAYIIAGQIAISRGCFSGTIDEFYDNVESHHGDNEHGQFYKALRPIIEMKLNKFIEGDES